DRTRYFRKWRAPAATSDSWITTLSAVTVALSGMGLQPPGCPTVCGLTGAAQFLQTIPCGPLVKPTPPQISQASNTVATLPSGLRYSQKRTGTPFSVAT